MSFLSFDNTKKGLLKIKIYRLLSEICYVKIQIGSKEIYSLDNDWNL